MTSHRLRCHWAHLLLTLSVMVICPLIARGDEPRQWPVNIEAGQFHIHSDFKLAAPQQLANELQQLSADLAEMLPGVVHSDPVHIVIFRRRESYEQYMRHYFPVVPPRPAIFLRDRGPGMLFTHWHAEVMTDLRHEVTHALLSRRDRQLPLWLDEGLAEYFEVPREARFSGHSYLSLAGQQLASDELLTSLMKLENLEEIEQLAAFSDQHYVASWMWIHFLLHRHPQTRQVLLDTLSRHVRGEPPLPLSRLVREVVDQPSVELANHFRRLPEVEATLTTAN